MQTRHPHHSHSRPRSHPSAFHQGAQHGMGAIAGTFMLCGVVLGLCIFGLIVLLGEIQLKVIGTAAIGGLLYGLYSFFRNPV